MATSSACAKPESGAGEDEDDLTSRLNGYPEMLGDCKLSASSSSDDSSSSGTSSASSSSSSDSTSSDDEMQAGASHSEDVDVEDVPTSVPSGTASVFVAAMEPQVGIHVQRIVDRPRDMPSDHADDVHDWVGWPTFPPKDDGDRQQRPIVVTKVPHITHLNRHEFLPKMELQINTQGRFMQPAPSFRLNNLMDDLQYTVWLTFTELHGGACGQCELTWPVHSPGISPSRFLVERQGGLLRSAEALLQRWIHTPPTTHHSKEQYHLPHTSEPWSRER